MKSSMTSIRVIYVHREREREKVDFKSREVNCLKECALALKRISLSQISTLCLILKASVILSLKLEK